MHSRPARRITGGSPSLVAGAPKSDGRSSVRGAGGLTHRLRFLSEALPQPGPGIQIYPIQYLEKLRDLWTNDSFAARCLEWWDTFQVANRQAGINPDSSRFPWLRKRQKMGFDLPAWSTSFLWGPPGIGKTTTLGALLATYIQQAPTAKVLPLSTTNSAVDQAIVEVDKALEELTAREPQPSDLRKKCLRIGTHFVPRYYGGREHLLPTRDLSLIQRLMELHKNEPAKQLAQQYSNWKAQVEAIEAEIGKQAVDALKRARLAAMTTTGAVSPGRFYRSQWRSGSSPGCES